VESRRKKETKKLIREFASIVFSLFDRRCRIARGTARYLARDCGLNEIVIMRGFFAAFAPASN
jgi:hypothetical protein